MDPDERLLTPLLIAARERAEHERHLLLLQAMGEAFTGGQMRAVLDQLEALSGQ